MPTFSQRGAGSIQDSVRRMMGSSPNLDANDIMKVEEAKSRIGYANAHTAQATALAEKVRQEIDQLRGAERLRNDPNAATEYAGNAAGLTMPVAQQLGGYVRGTPVESAGPVRPGIDETPMQNPSMPDGVTDPQRRTFQSALGSLMANRLATGHTNADQLTQAGGNLQTQGITQAVQDNILNGNVQTASAQNQGAKPGTAIKLFDNVASTGATFAPATGGVQTDNPLAASTIAHNLAVKADKDKPPAGYRVAADGNLEAIPGGPADARSGEFAQRAADREEARLAREADKQERDRDRKSVKLDADVRHFSEQLQKAKIPEFHAMLEDLKAEIAQHVGKNIPPEVLKKYEGKPIPTEVLAKYGDIPGVGQTGNLWQFLLSDEGQKVRQKIMALQNIELKERSGSAVTDNEMRRYLQELGGTFKSDKQVLDAINNVETRFKAIKQNSVAGASDDVLGEYHRREGIELRRGNGATPPAAKPATTAAATPAPAGQPQGAITINGKSLPIVRYDSDGTPIVRDGAREFRAVKKVPAGGQSA